jgi:hypothetical protein
MTIEDFLSATFLCTLLGLLVTVPFINAHNMKKSLREAAARLKATRGSESGDADMHDIEAYEGVYKTYRVRLTKGWRVYHAGARQVPIQGIFVEVFHHAPLPFELDIERRVSRMHSDFSYGDEVFDKACRVTTNNNEGTKKLIADAQLQELLRTFLARQKGMAHVTTEAVTTRFINAWKGAPLLLSTVHECAKIVHAIEKANG